MGVRVFVAGGSGALGRRLLPQLVARGHQVTATATGPAKLGLLEKLGANGVVMDGLRCGVGRCGGGCGQAGRDRAPDDRAFRGARRKARGVPGAAAAAVRDRLPDPGAASAEAEDAVQETWLRYESSPPVQPASAKAFLSAVVTRISIDVLRSARVRREEYAGPWLPEPLLTDPTRIRCGRRSWPIRCRWRRCCCWSGSSPLERAVFVLREVFGFSFPEIGSAVGRSEAACRQLAVRARRHMDAGRPRFEADRREREELAARFFDALREGDVEGLRELLAADVQLVGDGGGKAPQLARSIIGAEKAARVLASIFPWLARIEVTLEPHEVNGQPGAIFRDRDGKVLSTLALDILDGQIQAIRSVQNPDKLGHVGPVADAWAVAREVNQARRPTD